MVEEAKSLINIIESQGAHIQSAFREYQDKHFIARTPEFFCLELCGEAGENWRKLKKKGQNIRRMERYTD